MVPRIPTRWEAWYLVRHSELNALAPASCQGHQPAEPLIRRQGGICSESREGRGSLPGRGGCRRRSHRCTGSSCRMRRWQWWRWQQLRCWLPQICHMRSTKEWNCTVLTTARKGDKTASIVSRPNPAEIPPQMARAQDVHSYEHDRLTMLDNFQFSYVQYHVS